MDFLKVMQLWLIVLSSTGFGTAAAGGRENGGGNWLATEFRDRARFIIFRLSEKELSLLNKEQIQAFVGSVADTRIELAKEPIMDEFGGDAKAVTLDDPARPGKKLIKIREEDWQQLLKGEMPGNTINIVFHEYLRSIDVPDFNEFTSSQLKATENDYIEWIKTNRRPEDNVITIEREVKGELIVNDGTLSSELASTKALASYAKKFREWRDSVLDELKAEIGDVVGTKGIFIEKSKPIGSDFDVFGEREVALNYKRISKATISNLSHWFYELSLGDRYLNEIPGHTSPGKIQIGWRAKKQESIQIHLDQQRTVMKFSNNPLKTEVRYWNSDYRNEKEGRDHFIVVDSLIQSDFEKKCALWKEEISSQLVESWDLVLLDCGIPRIIENVKALTLSDVVEVSHSEKNSRSPNFYHYFRLQGYQMVSHPTVYYIPK